MCSQQWFFKQKAFPLNKYSVSSGSSNSFDHEAPAAFKPSSSLLRLPTLPVDTDRVLFEFQVVDVYMTLSGSHLH